MWHNIAHSLQAVSSCVHITVATREALALVGQCGVFHGWKGEALIPAALLISYSPSQPQSPGLSPLRLVPAKYLVQPTHQCSGSKETNVPLLRKGFRTSLGGCSACLVGAVASVPGELGRTGLLCV